MLPGGPKLIHAVYVEIRKVDKSPEFRDPDTNDVKPGSGRFGADVDTPMKEKVYLVRGQIGRRQEWRSEPGQAGDVPNADGHVTFRTDALNDAGLTLEIGDKITKIAGAARELWVVDLVPCGTYGGMTWLVQAFYADRPKGK